MFLSSNMRHSPRQIFRSIRVWIASVALIAAWLPLLAISRLFERDRNVMRTGLLFRRLGRALTSVNPSWKLEIDGPDTLPERRAYVVLSNHQSLADIPLISNLKWEMKWVGKKELFDTPYIGWMMKLSGDIPVDRKNARSGARMLLTAMEYLKRGCSVMFFPEGTRTKDGTVGRFNDGAFHLAIKAQVPILPIAVEGSHRCLPKHSWIFGEPATVKMKVFEPVETTGLSSEDVAALREQVRLVIIQQIAAWRGSTPEVVGGTTFADAAS
jgi:1-acyl-sn-glycerol-3-phosphate acyltransferase